MVDQGLYVEVCLFFGSAGGAYERIQPRFFDHLLTCLDLGQYYLERDADNKLVFFASYWWIDPSEQQVALMYRKPRDIVTGTSLWVVDCVNKLGRSAFTRFGQHMRSITPPGSKGIAWDHRSYKDLRYFPSQKGATHEP